MSHQRFLGLIAAISTAIAWGAMFGILADLLHSIDLYWLTTIRYVIALPILAAMLYYFEGRDAFKLDRRWVLLATIGALTIVGFNVGQLTGIKLSGPEHGALMVALGPAMVALIQWIRTRNAPKPLALGTIVAAFIGVALVATKGDLVAIVRSGSLLGDVEMAAGVGCFALYSAYSGTFSDWSWLRFTTLSLGLGTIASIVASIGVTAFGIVPIPHPVIDARFIWEIAYMAFIAVIVGFACWNFAIRALGAQNTILFMNGVPIVAFILAVIEGNHLAPMEYLGASITVAALIAFNALSRPNEKATRSRVALAEDRA
jgi:drug/metabolite transporter (DMT)-like permease